MAYRENITMVCKVDHIGDIERYNRPKREAFFKRMIDLSTHDGQILFCEIRKMNLLEAIRVGDIVEVGISFAGSNKDGKKYNNIFINQLKKK